MVIFWRLILAHFLADFTFQTNWVASIKRKKMWGMLIHTGMHPVVTVVLTFPFLQQHWIDTSHVKLSGWACVLLLFLAHYLQDQWRVFTISHFKTADSTLHFLWDQLVHFGFIFAVFPFLVATKGPIAWVPETWPVLGILFVTITHFTTVLVYFIEKDLWAEKYPTFDEKYISMLERLILAMCFLLPGWWWLPSAVGCASGGYLVRKKGYLDFSWFSFYLGSAIAAASGILARIILP